VLRGAAKLPVVIEVAAAPEDRQVFIDAEELLGLHVEAKAGRPVVASLRPLSPITRWRGWERLVGARIATIAGMKVDDMAAMRQVLAQLRQVGRSGTVAITFALKDGQDLAVSDYPVSDVMR
jgi:hypothetical protein